jgi:hypothetical protein
MLQQLGIVPPPKTGEPGLALMLNSLEHKKEWLMTKILA